MNARQRYERQLQVWSDIRRHLPVLRERASGNVLELGTRNGVSTVALLAGVEENGGHVWSVDVNDCAALFAWHPRWTFIRADSCDVGAITASGVPDDLDLLFLDTLHHYEQVKQELDTWGNAVVPGGSILVHDTELYPQGAGQAVQDWTVERGYVATFRSGSNGLGIIEVP
jgi:predicted O-methyltransferase YrrM